jgi:predicted nucleic acid-binding protein
MSRIALDTNILIYLHDIERSKKREVANQLVVISPVISNQVISEYLNVCNRRLKMSKQDCLNSLLSWLPYCELSLTDLSIYPNALKLINKYQFQLFDAIIVSSALHSNCDILYSEDMQHNLVINDQLKIINPFV